MIAVYIILSVILIIAFVLCLHASVHFSFNGNDFITYTKLGFLKFNILPEKKKKPNYKKTARFLRDKKLSNAKKRTSNKKKSKDFEKTGDTIEDLIAQLSEAADNPELTRFILKFCKTLLFRFRHSIKIEIKRIHIGVNGGDAAASAIQCGIAYSAVSCLIEFLDKNTSLSRLDDGAVNIYPVFTNENTSFNVRGIIKMRIFDLVKIFINSAIFGGDIEC